MKAGWIADRKAAAGHGDAVFGRDGTIVNSDKSLFTIVDIDFQT